jgi:hypothetical protein
MLFFSRSRADLGLTLIVAALLALLTLVLFKLDDDVQLVSTRSLSHPLSRSLSAHFCVRVCMCACVVSVSGLMVVHRVVFGRRVTV